MKTIYFVSTNTNKLRYFKKSFVSDKFVIKHLQLKTKEIQSKSTEEVARFSASWIANKTQKRIIKEDVGLFITCLGGFPGPYLNQIEKWLGV